MPPSAFTVGFDITQKERGRISSNFQGFRKILETLHLEYEDFTEFPITTVSLQKYQLLIFACPDSSKFKPEEINALLSYVSDGGNLLLLNHAGGDQGRRTNLGEITESLGISFINDEVLDTSSNLDIESYPIISTFTQHPLLENIDSICYRIGCSLDITGSAIPLALTADTAEPPKKAVLGLISYGKGHILISGSYEMFQDEVKGGITYPNNAKLVENIARWLTSGNSDHAAKRSSFKKSLTTISPEGSVLSEEENINPSSPSNAIKHLETQLTNLSLEFQKLNNQFQRVSVENAEVKEKFRIIEINLSNSSDQSLSDSTLELQDLNKTITTYSHLFKEIQQSIALLDDRIANLEANLERKLKSYETDESSAADSSSPPPSIISAATLFAQKMTSQNLKVSTEINAYKQMLNMLDAYYQNGTLPEDIYQQKRLKFEKKLEELQESS